MRLPGILMATEGEAGAAGGAPAAGAPAAPAAGAPAAPAAGAPGAPASAAPAKGDNIVATAEAPAAAAATTAADARKYLEGKAVDDKARAAIGKLTDEKALEAYGASRLNAAKTALTASGMKAEDLAKLKPDEILKKADEAAAAASAPPAKVEDYQPFTFPEGLAADEAKMGAFRQLAFDAKLPQAQAQKFVDLYADAVVEAAGEPYKLWDETQAKWQGEAKADKEIGGANYEAMRARVGNLLSTLGKDDAKAMREAFSFTGAGNHPAIIKLLDRAARALSEGTSVPGRPAGDGGPKTAAERMYPNQGKAQLGNAHLST